MAAWLYGKVKNLNHETKLYMKRKIACIHLLTVSPQERYFQSHRRCVKITTTH